MTRARPVASHFFMSLLLGENGDTFATDDSGWSRISVSRLFKRRIIEMSVKKIAVGLCCLAVLTAGVAEARRLVIKNLPVDAFPGVDDVGDLDFGNTFEGLVKISINLRTERATISGKASVDNESNRRQVFRDEDLAGQLTGIGTLISDRYVVARNGRATYNGKYADVSL
jgi:hypothetical protein